MNKSFPKFFDGDSETTAYAVFGISENCSQAQLKEKYKQLSKKWHPDVNKHPDAEITMKTINVAWELLKTLESRAKYDAHLAALRNPQPQIQITIFQSQWGTATQWSQTSSGTQW